MTAFSALIGVVKSTLPHWAKAHPEFAEAIEIGKARQLLHWEQAALRVAKSGGGPGTSSMIIFALKNMGGDEWVDKTQTEITGRGGGPLEVKRIERVVIDPADPDAARVPPAAEPQALQGS